VDVGERRGKTPAGGTDREEDGLRTSEGGTSSRKKCLRGETREAERTKGVQSLYPRGGRKVGKSVYLADPLRKVGNM